MSAQDKINQKLNDDSARQVLNQFTAEQFTDSKLTNFQNLET